MEYRKTRDIPPITYIRFSSAGSIGRETQKERYDEASFVEHAYAPYSHFHVGAVAKLANGEIVAGSNQENASFPVGLCAERVLLASASTLYPNVAIESMAISYLAGSGDSDHPIAPCGICRQSLLEYEMRVGRPIRLVLGGMEGKIYIIPQASTLLPLAFTSEELK